MASTVWQWWRSAAWTMLAVFALASGCSRTPAEQRLRESITGLQASLERRDAPAVQGYLAEDFVGPDGLDRDGARRMAQLMFLRHRAVGVQLGPQQTRLQADRATVNFTAAVTGGAGQLLPEAAQVYDVELGWRDEGGQWHLVSANWAPSLQGARN